MYIVYVYVVLYTVYIHMVPWSRNPPYQSAGFPSRTKQDKVGENVERREHRTRRYGDSNELMYLKSESIGHEGMGTAMN